MDLKKLVGRGLDTLRRLPSEIIHDVAGVPQASAREVGAGVPDHYAVTPKLPPYTQLPPVERAKAAARSQGMTAPQGFIQNPHGSPCEPTTMLVSGTKDQLAKALESRGWVQGDKLSVFNTFKADLSLLDKVTGLDHVIDYNYQRSPMTVMSLDGKQQEMSFEKNNDHHSGRDHLRVFDTGKKDAQGNPVWAIAATRDTQLHGKLPTFSSNHQVDPNLDPERDMIMADLLASNHVQDWHVAQGQLNERDQAVHSSFKTDGKMYLVSLKD